MNNSIEENELTKKCSKCGIVKMKTDFFSERTIKILETNVYNAGVPNKKNGYIKIKKN